jgi:hypothetical protein
VLDVESRSTSMEVYAMAAILTCVHQAWNSQARKSMRLRISGDSPRPEERRRAQFRSAASNPGRDDFQCAGRDLIHHNVVRELRDADAVVGRLPQG